MPDHLRGSTSPKLALVEEAQPALPGWLRIVIESLLLTCLLTLRSILSLTPAVSIDEDQWWHIRTGNWILQHNAVPTHDSFSAAVMGRPWFAYTWTFDILLAKTYHFAGLHGILTFTTLAMLSIVAALTMLLSRYTRLSRAMALSAAAYLAMAPLTEPRPWIFTILFFIVELYFLLQARDRGQAMWLLPLIPLFVLWANVHIQFVYGLALIGLCALDHSVARIMGQRSDSRLGQSWFWYAGAVTALATLANPYGWRLYSVVVQYATQRVALEFVQEMQAMRFRNVSDWIVLALFCAAIFMTARSRARSPLVLALLAAGGLLGFRSVRDVWLLAIIAVLVLARELGVTEPEVPATKWKQWAVALPVSLALTLAGLSSPGVGEPAIRRALLQRYPEKAAAYVQSHGLKGPLYNSYTWGGFLLWRLPDLPVSLDGRANLYGDERLARSVATLSGRKDWADDPDLKRAQTFILERDCPLASILRADSRYRELYEDGTASVFEPLRAVR